MYRIGRILRPHGLRGELHLQLFRPRRGRSSGSYRGTFLFHLEPKIGASRTVEVEGIRWISPTDCVLRSTSIADRTAAEPWQGAFVSIDPKDPPSGLVDAADRLFGALARDARSGRTLGWIRDIQDNGAQALLVIEPPASEAGGAARESILVPCVEALVGPPVQEEGEVVVAIEPVPGLFQEEPETP